MSKSTQSALKEFFADKEKVHKISKMHPLIIDGYLEEMNSRLSKSEKFESSTFERKVHSFAMVQSDTVDLEREISLQYEALTYLAVIAIQGRFPDGNKKNLVDEFNKDAHALGLVTKDGIASNAMREKLCDFFINSKNPEMLLLFNEIKDHFEQKNRKSSSIG